MPAAPAAAEPPEGPPVERSVSHGLRVGPWEAGSVVTTRPSSGQLVLPQITRPASMKRWNTVEVTAGRWSWSRR